MKEKCNWDLVHGIGDCNYCFEFNNEEGPLSNGWIYCPNCGKVIEEYNSDEDIEDDEDDDPKSNGWLDTFGRP